MLTPRFKLVQDDKFVTVSIYAPFTHVAETEVFMDGTDFRFFSKPYFLRLHFPCEIVENDEASAKFEADTVSYVIKCPKVNQGEFFPKLDMITELCKPKGSINTSNIEVLEDSESQNDENEEEFYFEQIIPNEKDDSICEGELHRLGFGFKHENVFTKLLEECQEVLDVKNPDTLSVKERKRKRLEKEEEDFDSDHYLSELHEPDDVLIEVIKHQSIHGKIKSLNDDESAKLADYTRKDVKIESKFKFATMCGLLDVLFAYCYDIRVNFGEHTSESGWTISKLCATLVCNDSFQTFSETIVATSRRALIYPIYRHFDLTRKVWSDVQDILKCGQIPIIKALLDITKIFNESDGRYIFNQLYIDQYVAWVQKLKEDNLNSIATNLEIILKELSKADLNLELNELEAAAEMVLKETQNEEQVLIKSMKNVEISDNKNRLADKSDSDDDSESDTEDSDSDSTDSDDFTSAEEGNNAD